MIKSDSNTNTEGQAVLTATSEKSPELSIVIVTYQRMNFLKPMLSSLTAAIQSVGAIGHEPHQIETILCINGKDLESLMISESFLFDPHLSLTVLTLEDPKTPAEARNIAAQRARGEWNLFLDDDVLVPKNFLENFFQLANQEGDVDVWGGPNLTPVESPPIEKQIGWYLENFWIIGPLCYRYRLGADQALFPFGFHFSLCNLFVRRELFNQLQFKQHLKTAEENELIFQIEKMQLKTRSSDRLFVWHYRRKNLQKFILQIRNYGFGRGQILAQRCFKDDVAAIIAIFFFAIAGLTYFFPFEIALGAVAAILIWISGLAIQQWNIFRRSELSFYLIPIKIWTNYVQGILAGFFLQINWRPTPFPLAQNK